MNTPSDIVAGPVGLPQLSRDGKTLIVSIPIALTRQGGQKRVVTPNAEPWTRARRVDSTIVKALGWELIQISDFDCCFDLQMSLWRSMHAEEPVLVIG